MLEIKDLKVKVNKKEILKNISVTLGEGEIVVLLGKNGSGKSTLLRTLIGIEGYTVSKGSMMLNGKSFKGKSIDERSNLGLVYMYQTPPSIDGLSLDELVCEMSDEGFPAKETIDIGKELKIENFYDRYISNQLSGGERKRVELFTLSVMENSKVFLLDEPDSGVDLENIRIMRDFISKNLTKNGRSVLLVTHNGEILKNLNISRAYVVDDGEIKDEGDFKSVWKRYRGGKKI